MGRNKQNQEVTLVDMNLNYTNKYKYLGHVQNNLDNLEDYIKATKAKLENAYQTLLAIAGNKNFSNIEMQTIWELSHNCITSTFSRDCAADTAHRYPVIQCSKFSVSSACQNRVTWLATSAQQLTLLTTMTLEYYAMMLSHSKH